MSASLARKVQRELKKDRYPGFTRKEIQSKLPQSNVEVSLATVSNTLLRVSMIACRPRKTPLLKVNHLKARLEQARTHINKPCNFLRSVLWSDETKMELFRHNDVKYVFGKMAREMNQRIPLQLLSMVVNSLYYGVVSALRVLVVFIEAKGL